MTPLRLESVCFAVNGRSIIEDVNLDFAPSTRTMILGANGAGKSVLLRLCHRLLEPTRGHVWSAAAMPGRVAQAMVFQRPVLLRRSALRNLTYALAVSGVPRHERDQRAFAALSRVGLEAVAHRPARVLSGGEQQRLALARAWVLEPEVLFLDEPTAALDPSATREVETIIDAIHCSGTKIIMTTHNLGLAQRLGDEIVFLARGRIVERAPTADFFRQPASPEAAAFLRGELPWG